MHPKGENLKKNPTATKTRMLKEILDIEQFLASLAVTYKSKMHEDSKTVSGPPTCNPEIQNFPSSS